MERWSTGASLRYEPGGMISRAAFDADDAAALLSAGASAVELYSGFVYRGPAVAAEISRGLQDVLDRRGVESVAELTRPSPAPAAP